jgi:hypothetical protein
MPEIVTGDEIRVQRGKNERESGGARKGKEKKK